MYQVNIGANILYYPGSDDAMIYDTELNEEIGKAGEFKFKVPSQNPAYSQLATGALITIYKDGSEFWRGEIKEIETDFAKVADVYCIEDLAWLADEFMTPAQITNETYAQRFQAAIDAYNSNRGSDRQFSKGYLTNVTASNDCNWTTEYEESILDSLRNCICKDDGYIRVRRSTVGGVVTRYIDIVRLQDYGSQATQPIQYGFNLLDYVKDSDYGNLTNVLTPYGEELDSEIYEEYSARLQGTTISNADSVTAYGRHAKAVIFDGVTDLAVLNSLAQAYLTRYSQPQLTMEVEAVDLAGIESVDAIKIGDSVRIVAPPFAVDQWLYLTQIKRDIQNIDKNTITLSGHVITGRDLTSQLIDTENAIKDLPSKTSILDAAKKNALEILNGEDGGYVTFKTNSNDQITELRIANNIDFDQATKAWRWNVAGLAYLSRATSSDEWQIVTAATMDGGFVADFITTGTMLANRIRGGLLEVGNINNADGVIHVINEKLYVGNTWNGSGHEGSGWWNSYVFSYTWLKPAGTFLLTKVVIDNLSDDVELEGFKIQLWSSTDDFSTYTVIYNEDLVIGDNVINYPMQITATDETKYKLWVGKYTVSVNDPSFDVSVYTTVVNTVIDKDGINTSNLNVTGGVISIGKDGNNNTVFYVDSSGNVTAKSINVDGGTFAGMTIDSVIRGITFNGKISGVDHYFKLAAWGGLTIGELDTSLNAWLRLDYVEDWGLLKVDYGGHQWGGIVVTNAGNNSYASWGNNYLRLFAGTIYKAATGQEVAWTSSDERLKKNIKDLTIEEALKLVDSARPRSFELKQQDGVRYGFIAQELREELDDDSAIEQTSEETGYHFINYDDFIAPLCMIVKDLQEQINDLKAEVNALKEGRE